MDLSIALPQLTASRSSIGHILAEIELCHEGPQLSRLQCCAKHTHGLRASEDREHGISHTPQGLPLAHGRVNQPAGTVDCLTGPLWVLLWVEGGQTPLAGTALRWPKGAEHHW